MAPVLLIFLRVITCTDHSIYLHEAESF